MNKISQWFIKHLEVSVDVAVWLRLTTLLIALVLVWGLVLWLSRKIIVVFFTRMARKTEAKWDDIFLKSKVFHQIAHLVPVLLVEYGNRFILRDFPDLWPRIDHLVQAYLIGVVAALINAVLRAMKEVFTHTSLFRDKPVGSYIQLGKIVNLFIAGILIISVLLGKSPLYFFTALGAASAVLLLIFKDTILGFVASIQMSANDMVRVGDWVTMEKYGADGDVEEINLTTVKVRNFDLTITTIPTYAFITDSFKNWRGMQNSGGRRIKRAIKINKTSIRFCTPEMIEKYKNIDLVKNYVIERHAEIEAHNQAKGVNKNAVINGRSLTNIGVFRKYLENYLKQNERINQNMTLMVRQLPPTETGLPLEVYAFSSSKIWEEYETIMADIFDHTLAAVDYFELTLFQNPSGTDFRELAASNTQVLAK